MMIVIFVLFTLLKISQALVKCNGTVSKLQLCYLPEKYDKGAPPWCQGCDPMKLVSSVTVFTISEVDDIKETITLNLLLSVVWNDTRLTSETNDPDEPLRYYNVNEEDAFQVYFPTLQVSNAKDITRTRKYGPQDADYFWFLYPHNFEYQQALKVVIYCTFDFSSFPFDSHECDFNFGASTSYDTVLKLNETMLRYKDVKKLHGEGPIYFTPTRLPFFVSLEGLKEYRFFQAGYYYSFVGMRITLTRNNFGLLVGGYFGPTIIFSLLSLVSFSINPDIVPGRLGLLITLDLIATNTYNSVKAPPGRGFSYIEIWLLGVQIPILLAIVEYGILLTMKRVNKKKTPDQNKIQVLYNGSQTTIRERKVLDVEKIGKRMDLWTFIISLSFIIIFNIVYWSSAPKVKEVLETRGII